MSKKVVEKKVVALVTEAPELQLPSKFPQAVGRGIIVKPLPKEQQISAGGLLIADVDNGHQDDKKTMPTGILCHVGGEVDKKINDPDTGELRVLKAGDVICHSVYADSGFMIKGLEYLLMSDQDIKGYFPDMEFTMKPPSDRPSRKRAAIEAKRKDLQQG